MKKIWERRLKVWVSLIIALITTCSSALFINTCQSAARISLPKGLWRKQSDNICVVLLPHAAVNSRCKQVYRKYLKSAESSWRIFRLIVMPLLCTACSSKVLLPLELINDQIAYFARLWGPKSWDRQSTLCIYTLESS